MSEDGDLARNTLSRRLAAVWFADIVGFTSLAARDEDTAIELVHRFQEATKQVIDSHRGELVKFLGDGALAHFSSTGAALEAALELRHRLETANDSDGDQVLLRFGVHLGDIVLTSGDVFGDGVNVASRIQKEARPGEVVVSEDVWRQCRQRRGLTFRSIGPRSLKGVDEPVSLYSAMESSRDENTARPQRVELIRSIAVLPLDNLSGSEEASALADGIQANLLIELSKVEALDVISRTSVMSYRQTDKAIPTIAGELNVEFIIEGAVQSASDRVRLTVQLIDAGRDAQMWAESFDRQLTTENLFAIQTDLTMRIVDSLQAKLTTEQKTHTSPIPTTDLDAYRLQAQARMQLDLRTKTGFERAVDLFRQATERDPDFALAWVGLADALTLQEDYGYAHPQEVLPEAERAVRKALELDPRSAEAHASHGLLLTTRQDGPAAIFELEEALEIRQGYAEGHSWLAWVNLLIGRPRDAFPSARRAVELNPLSAEAVNHLSLTYTANGQLQSARQEAARAAELSPDWPTAALYGAIASFESREYEEALSAVEGLHVPWTGQGPASISALSLAALGNIVEARAVLDEIRHQDDTFSTGLVLIGLDETAEALTLLSELERVDAWQALSIHHFFRDVWDSIPKDDYMSLVSLAQRSWGIQQPSPDPAGI